MRCLRKAAQEIVSPRQSFQIHELIRTRPRLYLRAYRRTIIQNPDKNKVISDHKVQDFSYASSENRISVLVAHGLDENMRKTTVDFTKSFGKYMQNANVTYVNVLGLFSYPELHQTYDLLVVTYEALAMRNASSWPEIRKRLLALCEISKSKIMFPQDDYSYSTRLDELAVSGKFDYIFSPLSADLPVIYPKATAENIKIRQVLTGYFEHSTFETFALHAKPFANRTIDIGQRVQKLSMKYGQLGRRKSEIVEIFCHEALRINPNLQVDISFDPSAMLTGENWLEFLGNCKFTISRKGGASVADSQNRLARALQFSELPEKAISQAFLESNARKYRLGFGDFSAISPRLFEAAAAGVCQILERDDYLQGALQPWKHYVPLESDFSNIEEIIEFMNDTESVSQIIENAKTLLTDSENFTYKTFIESLIPLVFPGIDFKNVEDPEVLDLDSKYLGLSVQHSPVRDYCQNIALSLYTSKNFLFLKFSVAFKPKMLVRSSLINEWFGSTKSNYFLPESLLLPWVSTLFFRF